MWKIETALRGLGEFARVCMRNTKPSHHHFALFASAKKPKTVQTSRPIARNPNGFDRVGHAVTAAFDNQRITLSDHKSVIT